MNEITLVNGRLEDLLSQKNHLAEKVRALEVRLSRALRDFEFDLAETLFSQIVELQKIMLFADEIKAGFEVGIDRALYLAGSSLLHEAFTLLGRQRNESILYATGNRFHDAYILTRLISPELERSELGYASADNASSLNKLGELEQHGSLLCGYFHMHPGKGGSATIPSSTDLSCQGRFEKGGYPAIGGIFSRDGYLRFFSDKLQFTISFSGKGVEHVGENLFKITGIA